MDYRQAISITTWAIVAGAAVSLLLQLPTAVLHFEALGSPVSFTISDTTIMAVFIAMLSAVGTENVIRLHPHFASQPTNEGGRTWAFWGLPSALAVLAVLLLPLSPTRFIQAIGLLFTGALVALALFSLYGTVERGGIGYRRGRILLNVLAYGAALVLFLLVYQTRARSLLSGTLVAATAMLLAVELLRSTTERVDLVLTYAAVVGAILGEVTWALNYWLLPGVTGGLLLLLIFYLLVGLAQNGLEGRLTRRVVLEFAVFAVLALILIAVVGPGF